MGDLNDIEKKLEKKKFEDLSEAELEQLLDAQVASGDVELTIIDGVKKYNLSKKGIAYVEKELLPRLGVPTAAQIIDQAKKGGGK